MNQQSISLRDFKYNGSLDTPLIFSGRSHPQLAEETAKYLEVPLSKIQWSLFKNGDRKPRPIPTIRKRDVFIIQTSCHDINGDHVNDHFVDLLVIIDACKRASAASICVVLPMGFQTRQDRKTGSHEPITSALFARLIERAGATSAVCVRLHSEQQQGFYDIPVDNIETLPLFVERIRGLNIPIKDLCIVSPDVGAVKSVERYADELGCKYAIIHKEHDGDNSVEIRDVIGKVEDKVCIMIDDMIDTGGTVIKGRNALHERGARKVYLMATHAVFSDNAHIRLKDGGFEKIFVTDTVPIAPEARFDGLEIIPISEFLAQRMYERHTAITVQSLAETHYRT